MSSSVLLLTGAVGAGKSEASYRIFERLRRAGLPTARLDLDDLGMCHPAPADDEHNHAVKAAVLGAGWPVFRDRGTERLVLAGGVETAAQYAHYRAQVPGAGWTVVRLRLTDPDRRRERTVLHGRSLGMTDAAIDYWVRTGEEEERLLAGESFSDHVVDTADLDRNGVVDRVLDMVGWG